MERSDVLNIRNGPFRNSYWQSALSGFWACRYFVLRRHSSLNSTMNDKIQSHWPITLTSGAAALINLFLPLVLVRILSPDQVGRYSIFFLYVTLSSGLLMVSGLSNGLYYWTGKYPEAKTEVRQSWTLLLGITFTLCAIGLVFAERLAPLVKISNLDLRLLLLSAPFNLGSFYMEDLMIARGDIWTGSWYSSGCSVLRTMSLLAAAWRTRDVESMLWVFFVVSLVRLSIGWFLLHRTRELRFIFSWEKTKNVLRYALPLSTAMLSSLMFQNVDQMILSFRLSPTEFAFYSMGCLAIPPLLSLEMSVNRLLIPRLSLAFANEEYTRATTLFSEAVSELFRFLLPAAVGLMIYSQPIVWILFTDRYLAAAHFLRIYALLYIFLSLPFDVVARARGDGSWILRTSLRIAPLSTLATCLAVTHWGAMGALLTFLATQLMLRLYSLIYQRRCFGVAYANFLPLQEILVETKWALFATAGSFLLRPLFSDPRVWFLVTGPIFVVIYFGGTFAVHLKRASSLAVIFQSIWKSGSRGDVGANEEVA